MGSSESTSLALTWREQLCFACEQFEHSEIKSERRKEQSQRARALAVRVLRELGSSEESVERSESGAPVWPSPFVGSISHTTLSERQSLVAVALMRDSSNLVGIDVEPLSSESRVVRVAPRLFNEREQALLSKSSIHALVAFSAKEAIYKALNPVYRKYIGFMAAEVLYVEEGSLKFRLTEPLAKTCAVASEISVSYEIQESYVLTWLSLKPTLD